MSSPELLRVSLWRPDTPRPADGAHVVGCWRMAEAAVAQHPLNARALWRGDELLAMGGVLEWVAGDAFAFVWARPGLSLMAWRTALPALQAGLWSCHERGMRRISAIVAATWPEAVRLVKRLGFRFMGLETGFPSTDQPMLKYVHAWPELPKEPAPVRRARAELELACLHAWGERA